MPRPVSTMKLGGETFELKWRHQDLEFFEDNRGIGIVKAVTQETGAKTLAWAIASGIMWRYGRTNTSPQELYDKVSKAFDDEMDAGGSFPDIMNKLYRALNEQGILNRKREDNDAHRPLEIQAPSDGQ